MTPATVLFDEDCSLCRTLMALASRKPIPGLTFQSWQEWKKNPLGKEGVPIEYLQAEASVLRVWDGQLMHEGELAWQFLLRVHPDLSAFGWIADRLGITPQVASFIKGSGDFLRKFCRRCNLPLADKLSRS